MYFKHIGRPRKDAASTAYLSACAAHLCARNSCLLLIPVGPFKCVFTTYPLPNRAGQFDSICPRARYASNDAYFTRTI